MKRTSLYLILIFLVTETFCQQLSFKEAIDIALKNNVVLRQQYNVLRVNQANKTFNYARFLPTVFINGSVSQTDGQQFDQIQGVLAFTKSERFNATLGANLTLFDGFNRFNSIKQANLQLESQKSFLERTKQQLIFDVAGQYLQILLDKELLKIAQDNLVVQNTTLDQIKAFVELGSRAIPDQYTQEALVLQLEVLKIRAENRFRSNKAILIQTLQLDPGVDVDPFLPDWDINTLLVQDYSIEDLYETAKENRPDYKQSQFDMESNKRGIQVATSGYYPSLTAFYRYGSNFSSLVAQNEFVPTNVFPVIGYLNGDINSPVTDVNPEFDRFTSEVPFSDQFFDNNLVSTIGISFNIPIFDGLQSKISRANAKMLYNNSKLNRENLERVIYADVQNAYLDFVASKENYLATQKQFEAAEKVIEVQQERYQLGIGNLIELSQANNNYVQGAAAKAQAEYTLMFQKIILDYNLGILILENIN